MIQSFIKEQLVTNFN